MNENRHTLFDVLKPEFLSAALHHNSVEDSFNLYIYIYIYDCYTTGLTPLPPYPKYQ